jgi:flagellar M-ring protein FliF
MSPDIEVYGNQKSGNSFKKLLDALSLFQKISIGLVFIVVIIATFMLIRCSDDPEYAVLFTGLAEKEAANIASKLDEASIAYKVSQDGSSISVNREGLADARLMLAGEGVPYNSVTGFELFDQQFFGLTDFTQKVNYQRALEGELSRTISEISEIDSARVHLVLSEDELFSEESNESSASVVLKLNDYVEIKNESVRAIKNLVSNAVKGLDQENISIIDSYGNLLTAGSDTGQDLSDSHSIVSGIEKEIEGKISNMLVQLLGSANSIVRVKAELDFDKKASETETYLPGEDGKGLVLNENMVSESYDRSISDDIAEGEAGTDSNVPEAGEEIEEDIPSYGEIAEEAGQESNVYNRNESQTQYGVSRRIDTVEYGSGGIKRLSVGVFIDSELTGEELKDLESVIAAAAGIDGSRGDTVAIKTMDFARQDDIFMEEVPGAADAGVKDRILGIFSKAWPAILLLILVVLLTFRSLGFPGKKKSREARNIGTLENKQDALETNQDMGRLESSTENSFLFEEDDLSNFFASRDSALTKEEKRKKIMGLRKKVLKRMDENIYSELKQVISVEVKDSPELGAKVIKNWITEKTG